MVLSAHILLGYSSVNSWNRALTLAELTGSEDVDVYFRLVDKTLDIEQEPGGRRYCPPAGAVLTVTINDLDSSKVITRVATQPAPTLDSSIWKLSIFATDALAGTKSILLNLNEGGVIRRGIVHQALRFYPYDTSC